jgi:hypothetical protein
MASERLSLAWQVYRCEGLLSYNARYGYIERPFPSALSMEMHMQKMTSESAIVVAFMEALEAKEFTRATGYLADTATVAGLTPAPLSKNHFIGVMSELAEGFPDLVLNFHLIGEAGQTEEGSQVRGTVQMSGTQVNSFELPALGIGQIPEMGRSISLPEEIWEYLVRENVIASIRVERKPGGGIEGLLNQLGIHDPIEQ